MQSDNVLFPKEFFFQKPSNHVTVYFQKCKIVAEGKGGRRG